MISEVFINIKTQAAAKELLPAYDKSICPLLLIEIAVLYVLYSFIQLCLYIGVRIIP